MNIYELESQATPEPWFAVHGKGTCFHEGNLDSVQRVSGYDGDEEQIETVAEFWPTPKKQQAKADAQLVAHCRNNFMRALKALKTLPRMWNEDHSELCVSALEINRLIAELEEVK